MLHLQNLKSGKGLRTRLQPGTRDTKTTPILKQRRFFVDNLMLGVQLADVSTRCSNHPQGKSETRCENDG